MSRTAEPYLSHLFIHSRDLAALRAYYRDALGLPLAAEASGYVRIGGAQGGFHPARR